VLSHAVQVLLVPEFRLAGLQLKAVNVTGPTRLTSTNSVLPCSVAVIVAI
jgi:hypothetical protein